MEVAQRDRTSTARALHLHQRVERRQRDGHVGWMHGDAALARAEDRVHAVVAFERRAARAGGALVAGGERRVIEVATARALKEVATDARHVAQLRRGAG